MLMVDDGDWIGTLSNMDQYAIATCSSLSVYTVTHFIKLGTDKDDLYS